MMMERFSDVIDDCNKAIELKKDFVQVSGTLLTVSRATTGRVWPIKRCLRTIEPLRSSKKA